MRHVSCWRRGSGSCLAADDGGDYLIGMKRPHAHLFADIAWSTGEVAAMTRARAAALGIELVALPNWDHVDDAATLARLLATGSSRGAGYMAENGKWN